jgi:hypothetical protein
MREPPEEREYIRKENPSDPGGNKPDFICPAGEWQTIGYEKTLGGPRVFWGELFWSIRS